MGRTKKINKRFKLIRWSKIWQEHNGGRSINQLARDYEVSAQAIRRGLWVVDGYLTDQLISVAELVTLSNA